MLRSINYNYRKDQFISGAWVLAAETDATRSALMICNRGDNPVEMHFLVDPNNVDEFGNLSGAIDGAIEIPAKSYWVPEVNELVLNSIYLKSSLGTDVVVYQAVSDPATQPA